jgi:chemotaxis family two-component system sensor kinase Cph1
MFALEGTSHMQSLMNDLLVYSRLGMQATDFGSVDMESVVQQTMEKLAPVIREISARVTHDPLPSILGNAEQMGLLLENLIDNAIKFRSTEPARIHIGVNPFNERWLFFLRDNGLGIDPLHTEKIFGIFQRLHSPEKYPGNGIGLAICRKIVEQHGGRIWVDSELGKGSTFYFTLQPAAGWPTQPIPVDVKKSSRRDAIADRATDLI